MSRNYDFAEAGRRDIAALDSYIEDMDKLQLSEIVRDALASAAGVIFTTDNRSAAFKLFIAITRETYKAGFKDGVKSVPLRMGVG